MEGGFSCRLHPNGRRRAVFLVAIAIGWERDRRVGGPPAGRHRPAVGTPRVGPPRGPAWAVRGLRWGLARGARQGPCRGQQGGGTQPGEIMLLGVPRLPLQGAGRRNTVGDCERGFCFNK